VAHLIHVMPLPPPDLPASKVPPPVPIPVREVTAKSPPQPAAPLRVDTEPILETYPQLLLDALSYPWRRGGAYILVPGAVLALAFSIGAWAPVVGLASTGIGACYFAAFYLQIVESTIAGQHRVPDWPSFGDFYDDLIRPGLQMALVFVMSSLVYAAIAWGITSTISFTEDEAMWSVLQGVAEVVFGFYVPMAVLGLVLHGHAGGAMPHRVIPAIVRCMPGYLIGVGSLTLISLLMNELHDVVRTIPYAGLPLGWLMTVCLMVMQGRLTGTLGLRFARRIIPA
jgi:hypothetical protein